MEVILGAVHKAFAVHEPSQVGEVRRAAAMLANDLAFDEVAAGRVALVATELGTNLVKHARQGRLLLAALHGDNGSPSIELLSIDEGPGIADVQAALADGMSTVGTPGTGLGAVRRLSQVFDLYSCTAGTVILARVMVKGSAVPAPARAGAAFSIGAVALPAPGETACGDSWCAVQDGQQLALLVADGLGHGPQAAAASAEAVASFERSPFELPSLLIERMHARMRSTRGAAVAVARTDSASQQLQYCGAGNIIGRLISGVSDRTLVSQHGTAGVAIRRMQDQQYAWPDHTMLVMHSDGLASRWTLEDEPQLLRHHPSVIAARLLAAHARGRDDATVVVVKRPGT